jgi:hypothetical protein
LEALVEPLTRGDPESPLRWTCKSTHALVRELVSQDHPVSHEKVAQLLRAMDYSLQAFFDLFALVPTGTVTVKKNLPLPQAAMQVLQRTAGTAVYGTVRTVV